MIGFITDDSNGDNIGDNINETQPQVISFMRSEPMISARVIAERIAITPRNVEANIRILKNKELVERIGSTKSGHWAVKHK